MFAFDDSVNCRLCYCTYHRRESERSVGNVVFVHPILGVAGLCLESIPGLFKNSGSALSLVYSSPRALIFKLLRTPGIDSLESVRCDISILLSVVELILWGIGSMWRIEDFRIAVVIQYVVSCLWKGTLIGQHISNTQTIWQLLQQQMKSRFLL